MKPNCNGGPGDPQGCEEELKATRDLAQFKHVFDRLRCAMEFGLGLGVVLGLVVGPGLGSTLWLQLWLAMWAGLGLELGLASGRSRGRVRGQGHPRPSHLTFLPLSVPVVPTTTRALTVSLAQASAVSA